MLKNRPQVPLRRREARSRLAVHVRKLFFAAAAEKSRFASIFFAAAF
jgi:hypothetical protein